MENKYNLNSNEEIDFNELIKIVFTKKKLISIITGVSSLISILFVLLVDPIWMGSFNIVIKDESGKQNNTTSLGLANLTPLRKLSQSGDETQRLILKSPSVLMPVFEYVKEYQKENNIRRDNLSFKAWLNKDLDINFEDDSSVLTVNYKNSDKTLITNALSLISEKYKNYSMQSSVKEITRTISYLEDQKKIMENKSTVSMNKFNKFSVENGIGNIDGFIGVGSNNINNRASSINKIGNITSSTDLSEKTNFSLNNNDIDPAGIRFKSLFDTLEEYENQYAYLSTKLKPSSPTLNELKSKIESYKNSLKRPNEILIEYKLLAKNAQRDEEILANIENSLEIEKLQLIKSPYAWEMISEPTINEIAIFPKKKLIVFSTLLISSIAASLLSLLKEKLSGNLYSKREIANFLKSDFLETLSRKHGQLSFQILEKLLNTNNTKSKNNAALVNYKNLANLDFLQKENKKDNFLVIDFNDESISSLENLYIILESGKITFNDLEIINKYISLHKKKVSGWLLIQ